jgi:hypothetical protein
VLWSVSPYLRTVRTLSGATAMQVVHSSRRGSRDIERLGENIPDGHVFTQPWPAGPNDSGRDQVIYYQ